MTALQHHSPAGRVLQDLSHGETAEPGIVVTPDGEELELAEVSTPFDYLFEPLTNDPEAHLPAGDPTTIAKVVGRPQGTRQADDRAARRPARTRSRATTETPPSRPSTPTSASSSTTTSPLAPTGATRSVTSSTTRCSRPTPPPSRRPSATSGCRRWTSTRSTATAPPSRAARRPPPRTSTTGSSSRSARIALVGKEGQDPDHPRRPHPAAGRPGPRSAARRRRGPAQGQHRRQPQRREPDRRSAAPGLPAVPQRDRGLGSPA